MPDNVSNVSGGINLQADKANIEGDAVGRDKNVTDTGGGAAVGGDVNVSGHGKFVGHDDHSTNITYEAPLPVVPALHQLPPPPADFVGRETELNTILNDLTGGAVISGIRGLGGIGKTALALVIADRVKAQYRDAQFIVNLRGASDRPLSPAEALTHVIRAYHPTAQLPESVAELQAVYCSVLEGKRALILLDDARDAAQIKALLPPASCFLLITSRQHFHVPGLRPTDLDTLPPEEARELLLEIAPRIGFVIASRAAAKQSPAQPDEIASARKDASRNDAADEIARLCGYLPQALRAAGSLLFNVIDLDPADYAAQLRDERTRLEQIGVDPFIGVSVEASLNLSYAMLSPDAQRVFRQLSVFPATFDAAAEEAICADGGHRHLSTLLQLSLAQYNPATKRYHLHDLVRLFAGGEGETTSRRHAEYYKNVLSAAQDFYLQGSDGILRGLALFDAEWPNIQAGQAWAVAHIDEDPIAAQLCDDYPDAGTYILDLRLHQRENIRWLEAALNAARQRKDRSAEGVHLGNLGIAYKNLGETRQAIACYEQRLVIAREIGDKRGEGVALGNLGNAYADLGETRQAIEFYEQALIIDREIGDKRGEGADLGNLGNAYADLGETRKAIACYEQTLTVMREIGDKRAKGSILGNLGNAYADLGEMRQAIEYHEQALIIDREIGDRRGEGADLGNLGIAYFTLGETRQAIEYHEQALIIDREIGDRRGEGNALGNLGIAYFTLGETRQAIEFYEQALLVQRAIGDRRGEGNDLWNMALALDKLGQRQQAIAHAEAALKIYEQIEDPNAEKVRRQLTEWKGNGQSSVVSGQKKKWWQVWKSS